MPTGHPTPMHGRTTRHATAKLHLIQIHGNAYSILVMKMVNCVGLLLMSILKVSTFHTYFAPYSYERHFQLIAKCVMMKSAQVASLGQSLEGRELECITVGTGSTNCWMIHRQHPGESKHGRILCRRTTRTVIGSWNQWFRRWYHL
jgi:hypothetical protein